jgi:hypothetical protein
MFGTEKAKTCSNHVCLTRITELKHCIIEQTIVATTVSMDTTRSRLRLSNFPGSIGRPGAMRAQLRLTIKCVAGLRRSTRARQIVRIKYAKSNAYVWYSLYLACLHV